MSNRSNQVFTKRQPPLWRATPALMLSTGLHVFCIALTVFNPAIWLWMLSAIVANHVLLTTGVLQPRSRSLGPNMTHLPALAASRSEVALTFDDGPDPEITPRVLDLLDQYDAKASFFCVANKVAAYPDLAREIIKRGHSVENHTESHPHAFGLFGPGAIQREINSAQTTIQAITGVAPKFFRAPMGFRSPFLAPMVERAGLRYVSWTRRGMDTFAKDPEPVLKRLQEGLAAGDILLLHDGRSIKSRSPSPIILEVLPRLLKHLRTLKLRSAALTTACNSNL